MIFVIPSGNVPRLCESIKSGMREWHCYIWYSTLLKTWALVFFMILCIWDATIVWCNTLPIIPLALGRCLWWCRSTLNLSWIVLDWAYNRGKKILVTDFITTSWFYFIWYRPLLWTFNYETTNVQWLYC